MFRARLLPTEYNSPPHINYWSQRIHWTNWCRAWLHFQQALLAREPLINCSSHQLNWWSHSSVEESPRQVEQHVSGDRCLYFIYLGVGAGVLHLADGLLEGVFPGWNRHHHSYLLVQPVEDLCHRFNWSLQLQRFSLDAGTGWSALFTLPTGRFLLCLWLSLSQWFWSSCQICFLLISVLSTSTFRKVFFFFLCLN